MLLLGRMMVVRKIPFAVFKLLAKSDGGPALCRQVRLTGDGGENTGRRDEQREETGARAVCNGEYPC